MEGDSSAEDHVLWWLFDDSAREINSNPTLTDRVDATIDLYARQHVTPNDAVLTLRWFLSPSIRLPVKKSRIRKELHKYCAAEIAQGSTTSVYEVLNAGIIIKKSHVDRPMDELWHGEWLEGLKAFDEFAIWRTDPTRVFSVPLAPKPLQFYHPENDGNAFWNVKWRPSIVFRGLVSPAQVPATDMVMVEQITPLCMPVRRALWRLYAETDSELTPSFQDVKPCIAQVILQRNWAESGGEHFTLGNCRLYADQLIQISPEALSRYAQEMGSALAILNWRCLVDGHGVKFFLGGWPTETNFHWNSHVIASHLPGPRTIQPLYEYSESVQNPVHLWMTGLNGCTDIKTMGEGEHGNGFARIQEVIMMNDSFPGSWSNKPNSPMHEYWHEFLKAYEWATKDIITEDGEEFIVTAEWFLELIRCDCYANAKKSEHVSTSGDAESESQAQSSGSGDSQRAESNGHRDDISTVPKSEQGNGHSQPAPNETVMAE